MPVVHGHQWIEGEVIIEVALQFQVAEGGVNAVVWDGQSHGWALISDSAGWSWPMLSPGGRRLGKGTAPLTDARKGAITDGLTKAARMIGVGHEVFNGLVRVAQPGRAPVGAQTTVYAGLSQVIRRLAATTELPRLHLHLFRHTFAARYLMNGGDIMTLRLILGHTTLESP